MQWISDLSLWTSRCRDGIEIVVKQPSSVDLGQSGLLGELLPEGEGNTEPIEAFRFRSNRREPVPHTLTSLRTLTVTDFVNATTPAKLIAFFSQHGFLSSEAEEPTVKLMQQEAGNFRDYVKVAGGQEPRRAAEILNTIMSVQEEKDTGGLSFFVPGLSRQARRQPMGLEPTLGFAGEQARTPRLSLSPRKLRDYLLLEVSMILVSGARDRECERCDNLFLVGARSGRRVDARFCSEKCRTYAGREAKRPAFKAEAILPGS